MPAQALKSTSSAFSKHSRIVASSPSSSSSLSLRITIREWTRFLSWFKPSSAFLMRLPPSKEKGFVTTATVKIPSSWATSAITGEAPVPVPPPIPAVMKTMSAPRSFSAISSLASLAAWKPTSGRAPAPSPVLPREIFSEARERVRACLSVFAAMNSTWQSVSLVTIVLRALPPAPPTPTTLITVLVEPST